MFHTDMRIVLVIAFVKRSVEASMDLYQSHNMLAMIALYLILSAPADG